MILQIENKGSSVIFLLKEAIEWEDARSLDIAVKEAISKGAVNIVFDLSQVTYICSAGIGALVYNLDTVRKNNGAIYIVSMSEYIDYLFGTLNFDRVFAGHIFKSVKECEQAITGQTC